jgi:hypothetical protein
MRYGHWVFVTGCVLCVGQGCQGNERREPGPGADPASGADPGPGADPDPGLAQLGVADSAGRVVTELGFIDDDTTVLHVANHGTASSKPLAFALTGDGSADFTIDPASSCAGRVLGPADDCTVTVRYEPVGEELRTATLTLREDAADRSPIALRPVRKSRLRIVIAGGGVGEVRVTDEATATILATCTARCSLRTSPGQLLEIAAATPSIYSGLSGACKTSGPSCELTLGASTSIVTATFATDPKELWTVLPGGAPIVSAAFDGANHLITASDVITKRSPAGATLWQLALRACAVATGPQDVIYVETATQVMKLAPSGTVIWAKPLEAHAVGCGDGEGFTHNLAVGSNGAVAIHGDTGVALWDADGNLRWTTAVSAIGEHGVAIDPQGVVDVAVLSPDSGEPIDLVRFAADGTPLDGVEHITSQYHGMFVVDAAGRLLAAASGHSHTDAFGHSVRLDDPDYAPTGICAAGTDDVAWIYQAADDTFLARDWTVNRYHANGALAWTYHASVVSHDFDEFGTSPLDIAGAPNGRIAIVGSFSGATYSGGWIATFKP